MHATFEIPIPTTVDMSADFDEILVSLRANTDRGAKLISAFEVLQRAGWIFGMGTDLRRPASLFGYHSATAHVSPPRLVSKAELENELRALGIDESIGTTCEHMDLSDTTKKREAGLDSNGGA